MCACVTILPCQGISKMLQKTSDRVYHTFSVVREFKVEISSCSPTDRE